MIKRLSEEYISKVARAQISRDPEYFLSCMGISFIEKVILKNFILFDDEFSYVYIIDGNVVGYVSGVCTDKFYHFIIKKNFFLCLFYGARSVFKKPCLILDIFSLLKFLFLKHPRSDIRAEMFSWWVLPEYRINSDFYKMHKIKIGKELWLQANNHFKKCGIKHYRLITPANNIQSNRFYRKIGYEYIGSIKLFGEEKFFYIGDVDKSDQILL